MHKTLTSVPSQRREGGMVKKQSDLKKANTIKNVKMGGGDQKNHFGSAFYFSDWVRSGKGTSIAWRHLKKLAWRPLIIRIIL